MTYFYSIFLGTFVLEDVAMATCLALISEKKMSFGLGFLACFLGISIGDVGLYLLGKLAARVKIENYFKPFAKYRSALERLAASKSLTYSVVVSRFIPGMRLPTYLAAGFFNFSFLRFVTLTITSVAGWVALAFFGGRSIYFVFQEHWFLAALAFLLCLNILQNLISSLSDRWDRRALLHSWRKWLHFEFWPGRLFYIPIVFYYAFLSIRYRSFFVPFYASPTLANGGLIGESKWEFLKYLKLSEASTLKSLIVAKDLSLETAKNLLAQESLNYPFIIKPDVGQRGFGVRIIKNENALAEYLKSSKGFEKIIQSLSLLPREAGLFYIRKPSQEKGRIFSITDKEFPFVFGDGNSKLGELILRDRRARIIAPVYFERHRDLLDRVLDSGESFALSECGNHCQGAIFLNGNYLITEALTDELDRIAKQIPNFYFGRFDVRYLSKEQLLLGRDFEIVEVNGAGSEATHIWDARTSLLTAYRTLFRQWRLLFAIGNEVRKSIPPSSQISAISFLKESARVMFRKHDLSVSS